MTDAILTLNAGSSSLKFALFQIVGGDLRAASYGQIEGIGRAPHMIAKDAQGAVITDRRWPQGAGMPLEAFLDPVFAWIEAHLDADQLIAVGHRIVHGGSQFSGPALIDTEVMAQMTALRPLAPLHQPSNIAAVRAAQAARPGLPQVACFDTAFHHTLAPVVTRFALPRQWEAEGLRRYGFHGLSYTFVSGRLRALDPILGAGKVVIAHLGNGASLCAVEGGRSIDTTMGLTALDGLVMGTRCGVIDPGALLYLQQQAGLSVAALETLLYRQSGLLGVSGLSADMRVLLASAEPPAREAVELFVFQIARQTGALMSTLGGLDGFVFTAGIGENAPAIRAAVAARLAWTGLILDDEANERGEGLISAKTSKIAVWVIPTDEERVIAGQTFGLVHGRPNSGAPPA